MQLHGDPANKEGDLESPILEPEVSLQDEITMLRSDINELKKLLQANELKKPDP